MVSCDKFEVFCIIQFNLKFETLTFLKILCFSFKKKLIQPINESQ